MNTAENYWTLVRLDPSGTTSRTIELPKAKIFFQEQALQIAEKDITIASHLVNLFKSKGCALAALCLRCFISHEIKKICIQLEAKFGAYYGFTRYDLFAFLLDDDGRLHLDLNTTYKSLPLQVLQKFDLSRASLATWTDRLVRQQHELNAFLLEQGLCMLSDWALLNETQPEKLRRVLTRSHQLTEREVEQAIPLLESYHAVYRRDRILQGQKGACPPPTIAQLQEMSDLCQQQKARSIPPDVILTRLTSVAQRLRQYRISVGGGKPPSQSLDQSNTPLLDQLGQNSQNLSDDPQIEFLKAYDLQFLGCLENAVKQAVDSRLQTLKPPKDKYFLTALKLFYCQKVAMGAIAKQIELQAQYQVSRFLKLDELRSDVRHWMFQCLQHSVKSIALDYAEPDKLDQIDQQIELALEEEVDILIQQEQANTKTRKDHAVNTLLAQKLCQYLDTLSAT